MKPSTAIGLAVGGALLVGAYFLIGRRWLAVQRGQAASIRQQAKSLAASIPRTPITVRTSKGSATIDRSGADGAARVKAQAESGDGIDPTGFNAGRWFGAAG